MNKPIILIACLIIMCSYFYFSQTRLTGKSNDINNDVLEKDTQEVPSDTKDSFSFIKDIAVFAAAIIATISFYYNIRVTRHNTMINIYKTISNDDSRNFRRYLHKAFKKCIEKKENNYYTINPDMINIVLKIDNVQNDQGLTYREVVNKVLADFDVIALSYYDNFKPAKKAAENYRDVLEVTSKYTVPFIHYEAQKRLADSTLKCNSTPKCNFP